MAVKPYMDHLTARASREYEKNRVSYDGYESLFPDQKGVPINRSAYSVPVDYTTLPKLFTPEKAKIGKDAYQWGNAYDEKEYYGRNAARVWDDSVTDPKRKEIMRDLLKNTYTSDLLKDAKETFRDSFYDEDMKITGLSRSEVIRKQKENFLNRQASICGNSLYDTLKHHGYLPEYLNGMHEGQEKMLKDAFVHEQGDFAKNLIQSYLTAMNVWPKEGEN